jgi:tRNA A37 threonylcarbamoyladenosine modification protein TsaB
LPWVTVSRALAAPIACLAARAFAAGQAVPPEAVDANYLRRSDAELKWKDPSDSA